MRKIKPTAGSTIDQAYFDMVREKENYNEECMCSFNGVIITSEMTLDECYVAVTGKTVNEIREWQRDADEVYRRRRAEELSKLPERIDANLERARELLSDEDFDEYKQVADVRFHDIYEGMEMDAVLDILEYYKDTEGNIDGCKRLFDSQGHSGMSARLTAALADRFVSLGIGKYLLGED